MGKEKVTVNDLKVTLSELGVTSGLKQEKIIQRLQVNGCDDCFFGYDDTCYNPTYNGWGDGFLCEPEERSDGKHVIFKEVKE